MSSPAPAKMPGCDHCSVTVDGKGKVHHERNCVFHALHKIGHILKEAGIVTAETAIEVTLGPIGGQDQ